MDFEAVNPETVTSVSAAARIGNVELLKGFLQKGKPSNIQDNKGWRALHHAAYAGNLECIHLLLKASDADVDAISFELETALYLACSSHQKPHIIFAVAKVLLEAGADPNVQIENHYINIFSAALCQNYLPLAQLLIDYKVRFNEIDTRFGHPINAVAHCDSTEMMQFILEQKLFFPAKDPLYAAFYFDIIAEIDEKEDMLRLVLNNAETLALINFQTSSGFTPLKFACHIGSETSIKLLLNHGADPNIQDFSGILPLYEAIENLPDGSATEDGVFLQLLRMTCKSKISAIGDTIASSPLYSALLEDKKNILQLLLTEGNLSRDVTLPLRRLIPYVDPLIPTLYREESIGVSPVAFYLGRQNASDDLDIIRILLRDIDVKESHKDQIPVLIAAVVSHRQGFKSLKAKRFEIIYYLLSQGADIMFKPSANDPLPSIFLAAILQLTPVCLEFLLLHCVPAEKIFTDTAFESLARHFEEYVRRSNGQSTDPEYSASHILQWLLVLNKYLCRAPPSISMFLCSLDSLAMDEGDAALLSSLEEEKRRLSCLIHSPKSLVNIAALKVRSCLWECRKSVLISTSVRQLCQKLPPVFKKILMFSMNAECERTLFMPPYSHNLCR